MEFLEDPYNDRVMKTVPPIVSSMLTTDQLWTTSLVDGRKLIDVA